MISPLLMAQSGPSVRVSWRQLPAGSNGQVAIVGVDGNGAWVTPPFLKYSDTATMMQGLLTRIQNLESGKADKTTTITINGTTYNLSANRTWTITKSDIGLGNVDNTSDINKPISNATQTALNGKEDVANKSTSTSLGSSNTLYPSQNAVKVYVDNQVSTINSNINNYMPKAGGTFTGDISLANDPSQAMHPVTLQYLQDKLSGLTWKQAVDAASSGNINVSAPGFTALDTVTMVSGVSRILLKNQNNPAQNGIYVWHGQSATLTRVIDMDAWSEIPGAAVFVRYGSANAKTGWVFTAPISGTLNATSIAVSQFTGGGNMTANAPIEINSNTISHSISGVTPGVYRSVTVDGYGHVTNGTNPTTLLGYGITDVYTKSELQTSGQSNVHWGNITNKPLNVSAIYSKEEFTGVATNTFLLSNNINTSFPVYVYLNGILLRGADHSNFGLSQVQTTFNTESSDVTTIVYAH